MVPQFAEKAPKTPKSMVASRMAPEKTQGSSSHSESSAIRSLTKGSPCALPVPHATSPSSPAHGASILHRIPARKDDAYSLESSDSEVEILATTLGDVKILD